MPTNCSNVNKICSRWLWKPKKICVSEGKITENSWKHCGLGEIANFQQIHLLSQCFQKSSAACIRKCLYVGKGWECLQSTI